MLGDTYMYCLDSGITLAHVFSFIIIITIIDDFLGKIQY